MSALSRVIRSGLFELHFAIIILHRFREETDRDVTCLNFREFEWFPFSQKSARSLRRPGSILNIFELGEPEHFFEMIVIPMDSFQRIGDNRAPEPLEFLGNIEVPGVGGNDRRETL